MKKKEEKKSFKEKIWEFFKPDKRKIVFTLILLIPFLLSFFLDNVCLYTSQEDAFGGSLGSNRCGSLYPIIEPLVIFTVIIPLLIVYPLSNLLGMNVELFQRGVMFIIGCLILLTVNYLIACIVFKFKDKLFNKKIFLFIFLIFCLSCGGWFINSMINYPSELVAIFIACSILLSICYLLGYSVFCLTTKLLHLISLLKDRISSFNKGKKKKSNKKIFLFFILIICLNHNVFAISDSNTSNNIKTVNVNITTTYNLSLNFIPLVFKPAENIADFENKLKDYIDFVNKTYPLADNIDYMMSDRHIFSNRSWRYAYKTLNESDGDDVLRGFALSNALSGKKGDRIIGIFQNKDFIGRAYRGGLLKRYVIAREDSNTSSAHEIAHTYSFCEEYSVSKWNEQNTLFNRCPNADSTPDDEVFDSRCEDTVTIDGYTYPSCLVENKDIIQDLFFSQNLTYLVNLMGAYDLDDPYNAARWIDKESYLYLLEEFKTNNPPVFTEIDCVVVSGDVTKSGTISLNKFYTIGGCYLSESSEFNQGNVSFKVKDSYNNLILELNFTPEYRSYDFGDNSTETNESPFLFMIPYENATSFQFYQNTTLKAERNKTLNTPFVNITHPLGNELLETPFNITWNATDADGDNIYYAVLISDDGGDNYTTLDIDLNQTYYELDPNDFDFGENYVVKLLATDGVNTGNNVSSIFTLGNALNITKLSSVYSDGNRHIFEFIIKNKEDITLTNINWTMDFGDGNNAESIYPFNLSPAKDILVFVEHEYADNESHIVVANAFAGNFAKSKSITTSGQSDLQITSFNELYSMGREKVWGFAIKNNAGTNITGINWNITGTDAVISSIYSFNLTPNETIRVYVHENLTNYQNYTITAKAFTDSTSGTGTLNTKGKELEVSNIKTLYTNGLTKILEFLVTNTYSSTITNINWSLYTGEGTINAIYPFNLTSWENIRVLIENNYSGSGNKALNFSVKSSAYDDSENKNITV